MKVKWQLIALILHKIPANLHYVFEIAYNLIDFSLDL